MEEQRYEIPAYLNFIKNEYEIEEPIGEGTFSVVYKGRCLRTGIPVALKVITKTTSPNRILEELNILRKLNGENNCIRLLRVMRDKDQIVAVFPFIKYTDFKEFILKCTLSDIKKYIYQLIRAVKHIHDNSIIHRDLKPTNFIYNMEEQRGFLIDFGLAQPESPKLEVPKTNTPVLFFNSIVIQSKPPGYYGKDTRPQMKAPRAGTRGFRAPEVLFKYSKQDKNIDMWSIGVILLSILTKQYPFFLSTEDVTGLAEIAIIFGNAEMRKAAKFYGRTWKSNLPTIKEERIQFDVLIRQLNPESSFDENTIDLLNRLLELICENRITADEALFHPFFTK